MESALRVAGHITEFAHDPETGVDYKGTCTQTALEVCMAAAEGRAASVDEMMALTRDMIAKKRADANGAATIAAVATEARDKGFQTILEWDYKSDQLTGDWVSVLRQHAGQQPILLQVANGQALHDAETGARDESGLHYHAIAVLDKANDGYVCADGDNPQVASRFQIYNLQTLSEASPCGLLMLALKTSPAPAERVPGGWSDDGTTLKAPAAPDGQHYEVTGPFRAYVIAHDWDPADVPLENVVTDAADRKHQTFFYHQLRVIANAQSQWQPVYLGNIGSDVLALAAQAKAARDELNHLRAAAATAQEALGQLLATAA